MNATCSFTGYNVFRMLIFSIYWQYQQSAQHYPHTHVTRNPGRHLASVHGICKGVTSHNSVSNNLRKDDWIGGFCLDNWGFSGGPCFVWVGLKNLRPGPAHFEA